MSLDAAAAAAAQAADPSPIPVVAAAAVALEARRSAAALRKRKNEADLASTQVHMQRLREENRRPKTRSAYSKCWRLWRVSRRYPGGHTWSDTNSAGQDWCASRGWEDGELVWENKAILFISDVVLSIRQLRPQKLPPAEAGARKRKMAAARQAARRSRLRQAEKDANTRAEEIKGKEEMAEEESEDAETSEDEIVNVTNPSLQLRADIPTDTIIDPRRSEGSFSPA
jgi:hypothetical protein